MQLPSPVRARLGDWDVVMVLLGAGMLVLFATVPDDDIPTGVTPRPFDWRAAMILALACGALLARRRFPLAVVAAVMGLTALWHNAGYTNGIINVTALVAYFNIGVTGQRTKQLAAMALTVVALTAVVVTGDEPWSSIVDAIVWSAVAVLFGELSRSRRALIHAYQDRAERAEADRESEAQRRVVDERLRIARDLHDLLGHTVSLMNVQANVAADKFDRAPEHARAAIDHIRAAGRQANSEIRATVELLRSQLDEVALAPTPTIADVEELAAGTARLGLHVECHVAPAAQEVDPLVGLTVYRIVQEALTNVVRHAGARRVSVGIECSDGILACVVTDDGAATGGYATAGHGLRGMTERVALAGGALSYGLRDTGGFEVVATLPAGARRR